MSSPTRRGLTVPRTSSRTASFNAGNAGRTMTVIVDERPLLEQLLRLVESLRFRVVGENALVEPVDFRQGRPVAQQDVKELERLPPDVARGNRLRCDQLRVASSTSRAAPAPRRPRRTVDRPRGHASISTTLNIYTHIVDASHRKAVEAVEERLFIELDPNGPKLAIAAKRLRP